MFCYQRSFGLPTEVVTLEQFRALITAPETIRKVREAREALARGDKNAYDRKKKGLPLAIFIGTFEESVKVMKDKNSGEEKAVSGCWRLQKHCRLNGLCVIDFDHVDEVNESDNQNDNPKRSLKEIWDEAYARLSDEDKARILFVFVTPSGHGLKVVFIADAAVGNLIDNQIVFSRKLGLNPDEACKDASRGAFLTTSEDIIYIDEERLITYQDDTFGEKYNEAYHQGHSQATISNTDNTDGTDKAVKTNTNLTNLTNPSDPNNPCSEKEYLGVPFKTIIEAWSKQRFSGSNVSRHEASVVLARDLYIMTDRDKQATLALLMAQKWVQEIVQERCEDVERTVNNATDYVAAQENENAKKGKAWLPKISKEMKAALEAVGAVESVEQNLQSQTSNLKPDDDVYAVLPLEEWAKELQEMAQYYPCLKELFLNVHPHKLPAVWFSSAALFGTLMTRAWYHFWYEPEIVRRLNYSIFIIGDPGAGKNIVEKFYKKIADPMIQSDKCLIDAVNRYKEGRTERTTSTKAQKGEALKRPIVGIRVHPARTATGEFIRHMNAAIETVQGQPLNLHMFSFDAELDNVTKQNKGGDWKDREILELKAFHNEEDGQMYANQESVTGMFNVFWNFIYTGTPYALHRKVNQRNFGTGMSTRLAVIPLPDKGLAKRNQVVDPDANETLKTWAYRLDRVEGEIPIEPLNDETYDWQSSRMEIAEFNGDKADRTLLKRIPYYGIGISLPFILMRHWDEWQENHTLTMDDRDKRLCRLAMEIQYKCQQFYFGEMAFNYFADQNREFVQRRRTGRYEECFRKLPDEFKTQQFMDGFGVSQSAAQRSIARLQQDNLIERVKYGVYRKVLQELP